MPKLFVKAKTRRFFKRIREAKHVLSLPGTGVRIALSDNGEIKPTRYGMAPGDRTAPFVQTDINALGGHYHHYLSSLEFRRGIVPLPYAETVPLCWGNWAFAMGTTCAIFAL